ncbi:MAG TPA: nucleoside triphosphate pyrophosphohydrolase [Anaerolineae bacterium]|nr:nucleoside triphosphate pyrophosphohydrolase [Anaerolineae bacterium]
MDTESYGQELKRKLQEEVAEFNKSDKVEELVDILEVVYALASDKGVSQYQLEERRQQKREDRGGFDKRIFLEEITSADTS